MALIWFILLSVCACARIWKSECVHEAAFAWVWVHACVCRCDACIVCGCMCRCVCVCVGMWLSVFLLICEKKRTLLYNCSPKKLLFYFSLSLGSFGLRKKTKIPPTDVAFTSDDSADAPAPSNPRRLWAALHPVRSPLGAHGTLENMNLLSWRKKRIKKVNK